MPGNSFAVIVSGHPETLGVKISQYLPRRGGVII
jgi:hypothetical protein